MVEKTCQVIRPNNNMNKEIKEEIIKEFSELLKDFRRKGFSEKEKIIEINHFWLSKLEAQREELIRDFRAELKAFLFQQREDLIKDKEKEIYKNVYKNIKFEVEEDLLKKIEGWDIRMLNGYARQKREEFIKKLIK